jgi:hypothetical protein
VSNWPESSPSSLQGSDGELVSVRITSEPRRLEQLLDALARLDFPINPQLYHDAATVCLSPNGARRVHPATIVEFPAWAGWLPAVRKALVRGGFEESCLSARGMLEDLHTAPREEPAPPGAKYRTIVRSRRDLRAIA